MHLLNDLRFILNPGHFAALGLHGFLATTDVHCWMGHYYCCCYWGKGPHLTHGGSFKSLPGLYPVDSRRSWTQSVSRCYQNSPGGRLPEATTAQLAAMNTEVRNCVESREPSLPSKFSTPSSCHLSSPQPTPTLEKITGFYLSTKGRNQWSGRWSSCPRLHGTGGIQQRPPCSLHPTAAERGFSLSTLCPQITLPVQPRSVGCRGPT